MYVMCQRVQLRVLYLPHTVHADIICMCRTKCTDVAIREVHSILEGVQTFRCRCREHEYSKELNGLPSVYHNVIEREFFSDFHSDWFS